MFLFFKPFLNSLFAEEVKYLIRTIISNKILLQLTLIPLFQPYTFAANLSDLSVGLSDEVEEQEQLVSAEVLTTEVPVASMEEPPPERTGDVGIAPGQRPPAFFRPDSERFKVCTPRELPACEISLPYFDSTIIGLSSVVFGLGDDDFDVRNEWESYFLMAITSFDLNDNVKTVEEYFCKLEKWRKQLDELLNNAVQANDYEVIWRLNNVKSKFERLDFSPIDLCNTYAQSITQPITEVERKDCLKRCQNSMQSENYMIFGQKLSGNYLPLQGD